MNQMDEAVVLDGTVPAQRVPEREMVAADATPAGLTSAQVAERLERFGLNAISEPPPRTWLMLLYKFWGVVPGMLEAAIVIDLILGRWTEAGVIGALLVFSAGLGFYQERRGKQAVALLRSQLSVTARVRRDGQWQVVPATQLVPDDLVHLRVGDLVPADVRLSDGVISLDQSQLTGESLPVEARPGAFAYAGSRVSRGEASGVVTATADRTQFGKTAQLVQLARAPRRLQLLTVDIARYLFVLDALLIAVVVASALIRSASLSDTLPFVLMLLVASVPVALPSMFTMSAALGARMLGKSGILVTRLSAIEDAATMDVLCIDKTGTITENRLRVDQVAPLSSSTADDIVRLAALASDEATQDPIDLAILEEARVRGLLDGRQPTPRLRFEPFDPETKRSEADLRDDGRVVRVLKGAPRTLAELARTPWSDIEGEVTRLAEGGSRVLAVATGTDEALRLVGLVALADPPRADSAALIADLAQQGVRVVLVTGDGEATARAVAAKVGIDGEVAPAGTITGDLDAETAERFAIFPGVLPEHKYRLVQALQQAGHVVGMTGDGVNDAPALGQADVGIAVATATDVAKASASLVLTRAGLGEILTAIKASRTIYRRMQTMVLALITRKAAIPPFLALTLLVWGQFALTPQLIVLFMLLGDIASFAWAADRVVPSARPDRWVVRPLVVTGLGFATLLFLASGAVFWVARFGLDLAIGQTQTAVFLWLVFAGAQAALYLVRARGVFWAKPYPARVLLGASLFDIAVATVMASRGWLMSPISLAWIGSLLAASIGFLAVGNGFRLAASAAVRRVVRESGGEAVGHSVDGPFERMTS
jgi:H+-transporting ATPase